MSKRNILLVVEGESAEPKLIKKIIECFDEITFNLDNIFEYRNNLWKLNDELSNIFGDNWYKDKESMDFIDFVKSKKPEYKDIKFTDVFLIFDYERQDPRFDHVKLTGIADFFDDSTEQGLLYLNYPMVESYKHLKAPLDDMDFLTRICPCHVLKSKHYKMVVGNESSYTDLSKIDRDTFRKMVIHHLCKAAYIVNGKEEISEDAALNAFNTQNIMKLIIQEQNKCSYAFPDGYVQVLSTALFFIPEYRSNLIFKKDS